jgi:hypothetical protein
MGKNDLNSPDFKRKKIQIARFGRQVPVGSQEYRKILVFFLISYLVCSQIWLNHLMDDLLVHLHHKIEKTTLLAS